MGQLALSVSGSIYVDTSTMIYRMEENFASPIPPAT